MNDHDIICNISHKASIISLINALYSNHSNDINIKKIAINIYNYLLNFDSKFDDENNLSYNDNTNGWCSDIIYILNKYKLCDAARVLPRLFEILYSSQLLYVQLPFNKSILCNNNIAIKSRKAYIYRLTNPDAILSLLFHLSASGNRHQNDHAFQLGSISEQFLLQSNINQSISSMYLQLMEKNNKNKKDSKSQKFEDDYHRLDPYIGVNSEQFESIPSLYSKHILGDSIRDGLMRNLVASINKSNSYDHRSKRLLNIKNVNNISTMNNNVDLQLHTTTTTNNNRHEYSLSNRILDIKSLPLQPPNLLTANTCTNNMSNTNSMASTKNMKNTNTNSNTKSKININNTITTPMHPKMITNNQDCVKENDTNTNITNYDTIMKRWLLFDNTWQSYMNKDSVNDTTWDDLIKKAVATPTPGKFLKRRKSSIIQLLAEPMKRHWLFEDTDGIPDVAFSTHIGDVGNTKSATSISVKHDQSWEEPWFNELQPGGLSGLGFLTAQDASIFAQYYNQFFQTPINTVNNNDNQDNILERLNPWKSLALAKNLESSSIPIVREGALVIDSIAVLQAIPSKTYKLTYDHIGMPYFEIEPCRLLLSGVSSLYSLLQQFACYGSLYAYLDQFSQYFLSRAQYGGGLVRQAFAHAVNDYLRIFRLKIMDVGNAMQRRRTVQDDNNKNNRKIFDSNINIDVHTDIPATLMELYIHSRTLTFQLKWLAELCGYSESLTISMNQTTIELPYKKFPKGAALLSYLYSCGCTIGDGSIDLLLKYLFKRAVKPYLNMLNSWIYSGELDDPCGEFFVGSRPVLAIHDQTTPTTSQTKKQWKRLGLLSNLGPVDLPIEWDPYNPESRSKNQELIRFHKRGDNSLPVFLRQIMDQIFLCGQTIHILRLTSPKYYSCCAVGISRNEANSKILIGSNILAKIEPPPNLCFTLMELELVRAEMHRIVTIQRNCIQKLNEQFKPKKVIKSKSIDEILVVRDKIKSDEIELNKEKKRLQAEFRQTLKKQILEKKEREEKESKLEKEEEKKQQKEQEEINKIMDEEKLKLKREHERHMRIAERREALIKWRTRRLMLQSKRLAFFKAEKEKWAVLDYNFDELPNDIEIVQPSPPVHRKHRRGVSFMGMKVDLTKPSDDNPFDKLPISETNENNDNLNNDNNNSNNDSESNNNSNSDSKSNNNNNHDELTIPNNTENDDQKDNFNGVIHTIGIDVVSSPAATPIKSPHIASLGFDIVEDKNALKDNQDKNEVKEDIITDINKDDNDDSISELESIMSDYSENRNNNNDNIVKSKFDIEWEKERLQANNNVDIGEFDTSLIIGAATCKSLIDCVVSQYSIVNYVCLKYFLDELQLSKQIETLRQYYFFSAGDVMDYFSSVIFKGLDAYSPLDWTLPIHLNRNLDTAIRQCGADNYDNYKYVQLLKFVSKSTVSDGSTKAKIEILESIKLDYAVEFPMNIIISPQAIRQYQEIFSFFLKVKFITAELKQLWILFKELRSRQKITSTFFMNDNNSKTNTLKVSAVNNSERWHELELYRSEMQHLITTLAQYLITQVLEVSWVEFNTSLKKAENIYDIRAAHIRYLTRCINRCFLGEKTKVVMTVIAPIFDYIIQFKQMVETCKNSPQMMNANWKRILRIVANFRKYTSFFYNVLCKLALKGVHQMNALIMSLDYNYYYHEKRDQKKNFGTM